MTVPMPGPFLASCNAIGSGCRYLSVEGGFGTDRGSMYALSSAIGCGIGDVAPVSLNAFIRSRAALTDPGAYGRCSDTVTFEVIVCSYSAESSECSHRK